MYTNLRVNETPIFATKTRAFELRFSGKNRLCAFEHETNPFQPLKSRRHCELLLEMRDPSAFIFITYIQTPNKNSVAMGYVGRGPIPGVDVGSGPPRAERVQRAPSPVNS